MKRLILLIGLAIACSTINSQTLNDSLLLYYPLQGDVTDHSGNGYHGSMSGTVPTADWLGNPNGALYFNGSTSFVDLPNTNDLKPPLPLSVSFWVNFDTLVASKVYVLTTDFDIDRYTGVWFSLQQGTWEMNMHYGDGTPNLTSGSSRRTKKGTTTFEAGKWHFVVGVFKGPQDMDLYINCRDDLGTYSGTGGSMAYSTQAGSLGRLDMALLPPYHYQGSLAELRYWSRALTPNDINELCNTTAIITQTPEESITVYPNPASDKLFIAPSPPMGVVDFQVTTMAGVSVLTGESTELSDGSLDISGLHSGMYIITIRTGNHKPVSTKFIKY